MGSWEGGSTERPMRIFNLDWSGKLRINRIAGEGAGGGDEGSSEKT